MNTEMHKRALAAREAHLALLELKKVVDEATQTTSGSTLGECRFAVFGKALDVAMIS